MSDWCYEGIRNLTYLARGELGSMGAFHCNEGGRGGRGGLMDCNYKVKWGYVCVLMFLPIGTKADRNYAYIAIREGQMGGLGGPGGALL